MRNVNQPQKWIMGKPCRHLLSHLSISTRYRRVNRRWKKDRARTFSQVRECEKSFLHVCVAIHLIWPFTWKGFKKKKHTEAGCLWWACRITEHQYKKDPLLAAFTRPSPNTRIHYRIKMDSLEQLQLWRFFFFFFRNLLLMLQMLYYILTRTHA